MSETSGKKKRRSRKTKEEKMLEKLAKEQKEEQERKEEEENDNDFAKNISKLADIYVNDAFSCSHRAHSSIHELPKFLPSYSGLQLNSELYALKRLTSEIKKPITCIIGGSKISTKIGIIKNLIPNFDNLIIVGGMANNILNFNGNNIGKSIKEDNCEKMINEIFDTSKNFL